MALPRTEKIKDRAVFRRLGRFSLLAQSSFFRIIGEKKHKDSGNLRVAFVCRKKDLKSAVKRNRLRRIVEEAYRILVAENLLDLSAYENIVFMLRPECLNLKFNELKSLLHETLSNKR